MLCKIVPCPTGDAGVPCGGLCGNNDVEEWWFGRGKTLLVGFQPGVFEFSSCWSSVVVESKLSCSLSVFFGWHTMTCKGLTHPLSRSRHLSRSCFPLREEPLFGIGRLEPRGAASARSSLVVASSRKSESLHSDDWWRWHQWATLMTIFTSVVFVQV
jgi:hypothetical protein